MVYWYEKIKDLEIPQPETIILELSEDIRAEFYERFPKALLTKIKPIANKIGYPLFVRTDLSSIKHSWEKTCYIENEAKLKQNIFNLIIDNICINFLGLPYEALVFRRYIPLEAGFKAFWGNMPVAKERRYFLKDGKVQCFHPYWPEDAILNPNVANWKEILRKQNKETKSEIKLLSNYALMVGDVLDGYWSIDFAYGQDKKWYLIDMATGEDSYHWIECKFCPKEMKEHYLKLYEQKKNKKSTFAKFFDKGAD